MLINRIWHLAKYNIKNLLDSHLEESSISRTQINFLIGASLVSLITILVIFYYSNFDMSIQKLFYNSNSGWVIDRNNLFYKYLFYIIPKKIITYFSGVIMLIYCITRTAYFNKIQKNLISFILFSVTICIVSVSLLKQVSNMYCPDALKDFNGTKEYVKLFEKSKDLNPFIKRGKCYPAGHASGGFALLCVGFVLKRNKLKALLFIFTLSWLMGGYQILKGSHFLSDTLVTMMLCITMHSILYKKIILKK